jgi:hypothetical protein
MCRTILVTDQQTRVTEICVLFLGLWYYRVGKPIYIIVYIKGEYNRETTGEMDRNRPNSLI